MLSKEKIINKFMDHYFENIWEPYHEDYEKPTAEELVDFLGDDLDAIIYEIGDKYEDKLDAHKIDYKLELEEAEEWELHKIAHGPGKI